MSSSSLESGSAMLKDPHRQHRGKHPIALLAATHAIECKTSRLPKNTYCSDIHVSVVMTLTMSSCADTHTQALVLRQGSVGVLTSVPVALVIKRAGYTHTHDD